MNRNWKRLAALGLATVLVAAACGRDDRARPPDDDGR